MTWLNKNMEPNRIWTYTTNVASDYKVPSRKWECCIISLLGSAEKGLFISCLLMFRGAKLKHLENYHTEMNSAVIFDWLEKTVFPKLKESGKKHVLEMEKGT